MDPSHEYPYQADTIVACSTAPGRAGRVVLRASGPAVGAIAEGVLRPKPDGHSIAKAVLMLDGRPCPVLAFRRDAPASYTGEDTLEIILPANPHLVDRALDACCAVAGLRLAGPGEFSARAYLNGRLSLDRAEGVAAIIAARTSEDLAAARRLATGEAGGVYRAWAEELTTLLALVEAGIDFVDQEDVVPIAPGALVERLSRLRAAMADRAAGGRAADMDAPPLVVLVGAPNAGKSTLFNALLGRERSVVADERGTTRDVLIEPLALDQAAGPGLTVRLADLPGLDTAAHGGAASAAQAVAMDALHRADAVVLCDPRGRFEADGLALPDAVPMLRVRTMADLPRAPGDKADADTEGTIGVCALDGWRLDIVRRGIADIALRAPHGSCTVALARHARAIDHAARAVASVEQRIDPAALSVDAPELVAGGLREAVDALAEVIGRVTADDVIGRVFATFCVGK